MQFQYEVLDATYWKTPRMQELDEFFGDIASVVIDIEDSIVRQVESKILEHSTLLEELGHLFAEIDCILSLADASVDQKYVRPQLVDDNVIFIKVLCKPESRPMCNASVA